MDGTSSELRPIAEQVLAWVGTQRSSHPHQLIPNADEIRRIELCAQVCMEVAMFRDLFRGDVP